MALKFLSSNSLGYLISLIKGKLDGKADKATTLSGYGITDGLSTSTKYAGSSSVGGAASSANKLATGRTIALGTGVTGTATSFNGESNITIPVTAVKEAYLSWGGKNFAASYGPIDAAMVPNLGANRLAFCKPDSITIEYSRDGGATWVDYGASDIMKRQLFAATSESSSVVIGKATTGSTSTIATKDYQARITLLTGTARLYTELNKFVIYVSTNGTSNNWCTIRCRTQADYEADNDVWVTCAEKVSVIGWPAYNVINISNIITYGNTKAWQYGQIQFIFGCDTGSTDTRYAGLSIIRIFGYGGVGWSTPSTLAATGNIYSYDYGQNATFPAAIKASSDIYEGGTAEANKLSNRYSPKAGSSSLTTCSKGTFNNAATYDVESTVANDNKLPTGAAVKTFVEGKGYTAVTETTVSGWGFTKNAGTVVGAKVGTDDVVSTNGTLWFPAYPTTLPASDVSSWAKASTRPSYSLDTTSGNATTGISASTTALSGTTSVLTSVKSAGSAPTLGTAIPADDITAWSTNVPSSFSVADGVLTLTVGSAALLSYTAKSIPNVTAVGSMPTFNSGNVASTSHTHTITVTDSGHTHSVESTLS